MKTVLRRSAAFALSAALTLVLVAVGPGLQTASAAVTEDITYTCATQVFGVDYVAADTDYAVTINVPATLENGASFNVRWSLDQLPTVPIALTGVSVTTTAQLSVLRPSLPNSDLEFVSPVGAVADLAPGDELPGVTSFVDQYRFEAAAADDVFVVKPGLVVFDFVTGDDGLSDATTTCTPVDPEAVLTQVIVEGELLECIETDTCTGEQTFVGTTVPESLIVDTNPDGDPQSPSIDFPAIETATVGSTVSVDNVRLARVTDTRTEPYGWSMTATLSGPLESVTGGSIDAAAVRIDQLSCAAPSGASGGAPAGGTAGGSLDQARAVCGVDAGDLGSTGAPGGQWDVVGRVTLEVPPFVRAGAYTGVLVLTVS